MGFNSNMRNSLRMVELGNAVYNFTAIMLISTLTNLGSADTCTVSTWPGMSWLAIRKPVFEIFAIYFINGAKLMHICDKNGCLYHIAEIHSCFL